MRKNMGAHAPNGHIMLKAAIDNCVYLDARLRGHTMSKIAKDHGVSARTVATHLNKTYARIREAQNELGEKLQTRQFLRLEKCVAALMPKVEDGDTDAIKVLIKVLEREAKLMGLDASAGDDITAAAQQQLFGFLTGVDIRTINKRDQKVIAEAKKDVAGTP